MTGQPISGIIRSKKTIWKRLARRNDWLAARRADNKKKVPKAQ